MASLDGKRAAELVTDPKNMSSLQTLLGAAQQHLYPNYRQPPLVIERGEGVRLWDTSGKQYIDLYAGIAVSALGHAHPELVEAISRQAGKVLHLSNYYYNEPNILLAEKLCGLARMDRAFFCNSGTEAIEAVLKVARRHFFAQGQTERYRVIAFHNAFHGRTLGALAATGQPKYRDGFGPLPGVTHVPYGDAEAVRREMGPDVAAILVEPVQGEGGVTPAPAGFLQALRQIADEHGALLLADEVQTGVGRTGTFLACEQAGVKPDAVALAKALGGGMPIGAMLCKEKLAEALPPGAHGSTYGGNPLAIAAALAVLQVIERDGLMAHATQMGEYLAGRLQELVEKHAVAESQRGLGLLRALVLRDDTDPRAVLERLREEGVLLTVAGGTALRFTPPLIIQRSDLDEALGAVDRVLGELS